MWYTDAHTKLYLTFKTIIWLLSCVFSIKYHSCWEQQPIIYGFANGWNWKVFCCQWTQRFVLFAVPVVMQITRWNWKVFCCQWTQRFVLLLRSCRFQDEVLTVFGPSNLTVCDPPYQKGNSCRWKDHNDNKTVQVQPCKRFQSQGHVKQNNLLL